MLIGILLFACGCNTTGLTPTFVQSIQEHRQDTQLVNDSLIATFQEEMDKENRPEVRNAYLEIIENLNIIVYQSEVLEKYIWKNLTEKELIQILKSKWRTNP